MFKLNQIRNLLRPTPQNSGKTLLAALFLLTVLLPDAGSALPHDQRRLKPESLADISRKASAVPRAVPKTENGVEDKDGNPAAVPADPAPGRSQAAHRQRNLKDVFDLLLGHPRMNEARAAVCASSFAIRLNRAAYFPKLNFSLNGGNKIINKTTRADEFGGTDSPEYDGKGLNAVLSLRQQVYDWGDTRSSINIATVERNKAHLVELQTLNRQAGSLVQASLEYEGQERLRGHWTKVIEAIEEHSGAVEARFRAGVGRIGDVREIQLLKLEAQGEYDIAVRRGRQAADVLSRQYGLTEEQGLRLVERFTSRRPKELRVLPYEATLQGRIIELDRRAAGYEYRRLQSRRLPKIEAVLVGRAWDIDQSNQCGELIPSTHPDYRDARGWSAFSTQPLPRFTNCRSHEVVGSMEFAMPLYDGGANRAQREEVRARQTGLEATRSAFIRDHQTETGYVIAQLGDYRQRAESLAEQLARVSEQLESVRALQGKTQNDPLAVARLQNRQAQLEAQILTLAYQIENIHLEGLLRADALTEVLAVNPGDSGC